MASPERPEYRPPSLRNFEIALGESDAAVEWMEVGLRSLERVQAESGDKELLHHAHSAGIRVNPIPLARVRSRAAGLDIIAVYQHFEDFLRAFKADHPRSVRERGDEDLLEYTMSAFGVSAKTVGEFETGIANYYRLLRNHMMHAMSNDQRKREIALAAKLKNTVPSVYGPLAAPNALNALIFDDFILWSRVAKVIARRLCHSTSPSASELRSLLVGDEAFIRMIKGEAGNPERVRRKLAKQIQVKYGYPQTAGDIAAEILVLGPLAQG